MISVVSNTCADTVQIKVRRAEAGAGDLSTSRMYECRGFESQHEISTSCSQTETSAEKQDPNDGSAHIWDVLNSEMKLVRFQANSY